MTPAEFSAAYLDLGFSLALWLTGNGAMAIVWAIFATLGGIPQEGRGVVMLGIFMLSVVREFIAASKKHLGE